MHELEMEFSTTKYHYAIDGPAPPSITHLPPRAKISWLIRQFDAKSAAASPPFAFYQRNGDDSYVMPTTQARGYEAFQHLNALAGRLVSDHKEMLADAIPDDVFEQSDHERRWLRFLAMTAADNIQWDVGGPELGGLGGVCHWIHALEWLAERLPECPETPGGTQIHLSEDLPTTRADESQLTSASAGDALSAPLSPKEWARVFKCCPRTFKRHFESGKIRGKKNSSRSYQIAVCDLPATFRANFRGAKLTYLDKVDTSGQRAIS